MPDKKINYIHILAIQMSSIGLLIFRILCRIISQVELFNLLGRNCPKVIFCVYKFESEDPLNRLEKHLRSKVIETKPLNSYNEFLNCDKHSIW